LLQDVGSPVSLRLLSPAPFKIHHASNALHLRQIVFDGQSMYHSHGVCNLLFRLRKVKRFIPSMTSSQGRAKGAPGWEMPNCVRL
jgi:hypothetical protein